jgi:orotate phosphoribosyltransferase
MVIVTTDWPAQRAELARSLIVQLYKDGLFRTWLRDRPNGWELISGNWSPFYITMRVVPSRPPLFRQVADSLGALIKHELPTVNRLLGLAATGVPLAAAVGYAEGIPMTFTRKLPNVRSIADLERELAEYGGHALVEGEFRSGDRVALVDDVVSLFDSKEIAIGQLQAELKRQKIEGVEVAAVVTVVDRGRDNAARAAAAGAPLHSLITLGAGDLEALRGIASDLEIDVVSEFVDNHEKYQDPKVQGRLRALAQGR